MLAFIYANQGSKDPVDPNFYQKREYLYNPTKPTQPGDGDSDDEIPVRLGVSGESDDDDASLNIEPPRKAYPRALRFETEPTRRYSVSRDSKALSSSPRQTLDVKKYS
ncbi:hypothetical protein AC1031_014108 [Aphanomyces cochlioides]|nr:hypothetical protein AC1031_014108 [Aphanomyces cochlioides]